MGVDYSPVGGIGIEVTGKIKAKLKAAATDSYECMGELLDDLGIPYKEAGDGNYSGKENSFYLIVEGETLTEINNNAEKFIKNMSEFGIKVKSDDLVVIEELHVW
jgi:hypothetical protein